MSYNRDEFLSAVQMCREQSKMTPIDAVLYVQKLRREGSDDVPRQQNATLDYDDDDE